MAHSGQIDLLDHLPGGGAEAPADANKHFVDLPHACSDIKRNRKKARQRSKRHFGFRPYPEPHNQYREKDELWPRNGIGKKTLQSPPQKDIAAEQKANRKPGKASDCKCRANLSGRDAEIEIVITIREKLDQSAADRQK